MSGTYWPIAERYPNFLIQINRLEPEPLHLAYCVLGAYDDIITVIINKPTEMTYQTRRASAGAIVNAGPGVWAIKKYLSGPARGAGYVQWRFRIILPVRNSADHGAEVLKFLDYIHEGFFCGEILIMN
ncbi:hypothetical protein EVAR_102253_1 [Eumeta japonica]|uniref:Uncharacterized protein n=1 Tax=Eumeta variegata TaxID=151549 RepID=A0A4C1WEK8_EUMVA|nr:hypothetical protein EVAR_102253_1 [Eumeta japonica]